MPRASNSRSTQPTATPTMSRPPEITSTLASSFATGRGDRYGSTITLVPSAMRSVTPASHGSIASGSSMSLR